MADNSDNRSSMVKLVVALLDDPHGISEEAFEVLKLVVRRGILPCEKFDGPKIESIVEAVQKSEGRVYLPENWDEEFDSVKIPVIGTMDADGQVEFNPFYKLGKGKK